jgi:hypothetical protein
MTEEIPLLDNIRVASPCSASWEAMRGDERVRFCGACQKSVYNLSGMTRAEAERLVRETEGRLCVRFYRRRDGTVLTSDCPVGRGRARRWLAMHIGGLAALLGGLLALLQPLVGSGWLGGLRQSPVCRVEPLRRVVEWLDPAPRVMMGDVAMGQVALPSGPPGGSGGAR